MNHGQQSSFPLLAFQRGFQRLLSSQNAYLAWLKSLNSRLADLKSSIPCMPMIGELQHVAWSSRFTVGTFALYHTCICLSSYIYLVQFLDLHALRMHNFTYGLQPAT